MTDQINVNGEGDAEVIDRPMSTADLAGSTKMAERTSETAADSQESGSDAVALFPADEADGLRAKWEKVQAGFVDEPRKAVEHADELVASAMKRLAETFADERSRLEHEWDRGEEVSTEDLRLALQRYRAFFGRLLAV